MMKHFSSSNVSRAENLENLIIVKQRARQVISYFNVQNYCWAGLPFLSLFGLHLGLLFGKSFSLMKQRFPRFMIGLSNVHFMPMLIRRCTSPAF